MSIHRSFTKCKAPDDSTDNGVPPSTRLVFIRRPPSSIKKNSTLNFRLHCFIILQHNYFILFLLSVLLHVNQCLKLVGNNLKVLHLRHVSNCSLKRIFCRACVIIVTCHMLSYNCSLDDRHHPESKRKSAHFS